MKSAVAAVIAVFVMILLCVAAQYALCYEVDELCAVPLGGTITVGDATGVAEEIAMQQLEASNRRRQTRRERSFRTVWNETWILEYRRLLTAGLSASDAAETARRIADAVAAER